MMHSLRTLRAARLALPLLAALAVAGCARDDADVAGGTLSGGLAGGAGTPGSLQEFQVTVGDRVFFDTDSTALTPTSMQTLDRQAQWLLLYPRYTITIEGHADERGTREYNIALGARRAAAVQSYLISRGVAANRIQTISYGKERPVAVCDDISCWSQNRRAVTVVNSAGV
ncbi:MAG: peptidoglycan-associated lipoprotein Pal [Bauldia sp.]|nr:peptidoglycan-associated lipoprotein Pal [Bauldia sp.]MCW5717870.1 peptidoglycan-associated lipoprotein Pal [Bauldia sp.]